MSLIERPEKELVGEDLCTLDDVEYESKEKTRQLIQDMEIGMILVEEDEALIPKVALN